MLEALLLFVLVGTLVGGLVIAVSVLRRPPIPATGSGWLEAVEIAVIERDIKKLNRVTLRADTIQLPSKENYQELMIAVLDNFVEGVEYHFLVPEEFYSLHAENTTNHYQAIEALAREYSDIELPRRLFFLHKYPHSAGDSDFPYIFYRYGEGSNQYVVGYRGAELGVGISSRYRRLESEVAMTVYRHLRPYLNVPDDSEHLRAVGTSNVVPLENMRRFRRKMQ